MNMNIYTLYRIDKTEPLYIFVFQPYPQTDGFVYAFSTGHKNKNEKKEDYIG